MSDAAFKTAKYPGYTTAQLETALAYDLNMPETTRVAMLAEIRRRHAVANGDISQMTDGQRLRCFR